MTIIEALVQLRNDLKLWVANNLREKVSKDEIFEGTSGEADGKAGLVPAPLSVDERSYLCASGEWLTPDTDEIYDYYRNKQLSAVLSDIEGSILTSDDVQAMIDAAFGSIAVYAGESEDVEEEEETTITTFTFDGFSYTLPEGVTSTTWYDYISNHGGNSFFNCAGETSVVYVGTTQTNAVYVGDGSIAGDGDEPITGATIINNGDVYHAKEVTS